MSWPGLGLAAIILLGFALRLLRLKHLGDLEYDEIVSVSYAALPVVALLPRLAGALFEHPPAFYVLLGWWRALVGQDDTLARLFSVVPGTLTIPLSYVVAHRLFGRRTAYLAALLVVAAPLLLFYSREVRMYALLSCLSLASFWLFLRGLEGSPSKLSWISYGGISAILAYVHYLGAAILVAQLVAALVLRRRAPQLLRPVALCTGAVLLLALPWVLIGSGPRASLPALTLANVRGTPLPIWGAWQEQAAGLDPSGLPASAAGLTLLVLVVFGLPAKWPARVATLAILLAGFAGILFIQALGKPLYGRYLLPVTPLVFVCAAAALERAWRRRRALAALGGAGLLLGALPFWASYYGGYVRADYSEVTRRIAALERPGDTVLLTGPWQATYFDYYYTGTLLHSVLPADVPPALEPAAASAQLEALAKEYHRVWFVQAGLGQADPTNYVERWLLHHAWPAWREVRRNAVLTLYALDPPPARSPLQPVAFDRGLRLAGGWVDGDNIPSGQGAPLSLEFVLDQPVAADYKASLRIVGLDGQRTAVDFLLLDRTDEGEQPTSAWTAGKSVVVQRALWVPIASNPEPHDLRIVIYDPATLAPLAPLSPAREPTSGGEVTVGKIYVTQSNVAFSPAADATYQPLDRRFGGGDFDSFRLVGVRWQQANPAQGPLQFDLLWALDGHSGTEHHSLVVVADRSGRRWIEETRALFDATFAMHDWRAQEVIGDRRSVDLASLPAGEYQLLLGLQDNRQRALPLDGQPGLLALSRFNLPYKPPWTQRLADRLTRLTRLGLGDHR